MVKKVLLVQVREEGELQWGCTLVRGLEGRDKYATLPRFSSPGSITQTFNKYLSMNEGHVGEKEKTD